MKEQQPVLVTTKHRGVFFGYLAGEDETTVTLRCARCAIRWNTKGGFLELADKGPNDGTTVGSVAGEIKLHDVTSMAAVSEEAERAWSSHE